jgi:hypothetical protein
MPCRPEMRLAASDRAVSYATRRLRRIRSHTRARTAHCFSVPRQNWGSRLPQPRLRPMPNVRAMVRQTFVKRTVMTSALVAMTMSPFAIAWGDAATLVATTTPSIIAGGPPGVVEPAPQPPPPPGVAPAAAPENPIPPRGSGMRDRRCGSDLFTGIPLPC